MFTPAMAVLAGPHPHSVSRRGLLGRRALRRFLYAQMALRHAVMIAIGREQPLVRFTVEDDPPSVYVVFRIREAERDRLLRELALPEGVELAPIRCLTGDEPGHLLTLNVYRVSGITNGLRAEWSVYVTDERGRPRYLVIDARASGRSMDPVDVITPASRVEHARTGDRVRFAVGPVGAAAEVAFDVPADAERVTCAPEWVTANDDIYWRNGICDRTFYDGGLADADQVAIDPAAVELADASPWAPFVEPTPAHVLVLREAIEFVVSPWANVDELARR